MVKKKKLGLLSPRYITQKETNVKKGPSITSFLGQQRSPNVLGSNPARLLFNVNLEYVKWADRINLRTKRGSTLLVDIMDRTYGAANYFYATGTEFLVWMDSSGVLKYYDEDLDTINVIQTGFTPGVQNFFYMYGQLGAASLFGANEADGVYEVSGATPTFAGFIAGSPNLKGMIYSVTAGRLMGVNGHTVYFTQEQVDPVDLSNLRDWTTPPNTAVVSPDDGDGFIAIVELQNLIYLFKDTGVWVLPNSDRDPTEWVFPKVEADVGTFSPKSVRVSRYEKQMGVIYQGTDTTLRFLAPKVTQNAGMIPTVSNSVSYVISEPFQDILKTLDPTQLTECVATFWENYYLLNLVTDLGDSVNTSLTLDTQRTFKSESDSPIRQPFYFEATNMEYVDFVIRKSDNSLFGFHKNGYISNLFQNDLYTEEVPLRIDPTGTLGIPWAFFTSWFKYSEQVSLLMYFYLTWKNVGEALATNIVSVNSFISGELVPPTESGFSLEVSAQSGQYPLWNQVFWNHFNWGSLTQATSSCVLLEARGNYFLFGVQNSNKNQAIEIYGFETYFKADRNDLIGSRV